MNRRLGLVLSVIVFVACHAAGQTPRSRFAPAAGRHAGQQKGFVDWALGRFNPADIDYGARLEEMRQIVLDNTLLNQSFRIDTLLVAALCFLYACYWWECRKTTNLRVSTARVITACHNELETAREQIARLVSEYTQARRILDERAEASTATSALRKRDEIAASDEKKTSLPAISGEGEPTRAELLTENYSLKQQVRTLTMKWQEEQQKNRKPKSK
jgi:hypothetical protein